MQQRRALGRGLDSLIPAPIVLAETKLAGLQSVPISSIIPNRLQPRTTFDDEKIRELSNSIREDGLIQPLIVNLLPDSRYELIAGERRLRAARLAGFTEVPVIIKSVDQPALLALSLIENIQREDLNPLEEAGAYQELIDQFGLTQDEVAKRVGKSRVSIANSIRLLKLPRVIQDDVSSGKYSSGHARALLTARDIHEQLRLREWIVRTTPTVRTVEQKVARPYGSRAAKSAKSSTSAQITLVIQKIRERLGTKVKIAEKQSGGGSLIIDYYSWRDLDRVFRIITGDTETHTSAQDGGSNLE